jgi:hypothetical protein
MKAIILNLIRIIRIIIILILFFFFKIKQKNKKNHNTEFIRQIRNLIYVYIQ